MSALGQKRTWRDQIAMSALPPKADIRPRDQDVCFGPIVLQKSASEPSTLCNSYRPQADIDRIRQ